MNRDYFEVKECSGGGGNITGSFEIEIVDLNLYSINIPAGFSKMEYLVVGGGAGGGGVNVNATASGGGGGGELIEGEILNPQGGTYQFQRGNGGFSVPSSGNAGNNGESSIITLPNSSTIVAEGGKGGAGSIAGQTANNATDTEGAGGGSSINTAGGTGTNAGGNGITGGSGVGAGAGGGGAGGAGSTSTSVTATPDGGGAGKTSILFGGTYGEGGGSFAVHGTNRSGVNGAANTGNGGSGRNRSTTGLGSTSGGSGIIKVRFIV